MLKSVKGFTAIEMAIVLSVSAMVMGGGLAASKPILEKVQKQKTERQMEKINDRLASYVHRNNRLPCPADPSDSSGFGTAPDTCVGSDVVGVVPFRILGLSEKDARDSWGNLISYHISPVFAANPDDVGDHDHDKIHEFCRSEDWVTDPLELPFGYWNLNDGMINCQYVQKIESTDGNVSFYEENGGRFYKHRYSDGFVAGVGINGGAGGHGVGPGENLIIEFKKPASKAIIKLTGLEDEATTSITFHVWGDRDAAEDDFVEVVVNLTQEWIDANVGYFVENGEGYYYFRLNEAGHPDNIDIPGIDEIHKIRILTADGPDEKMSYQVWSVQGGYSDDNQTVNINPAKARFCCPMKHVAGYTPSTDLRIVDETGKSIVSQSRSTDDDDYADKDIEVSGSVSSDIFTPAFALISHGPNGHGAYLGNGSSARMTVSGTVGQGFGSDEVANADGNNTYVYRMPDMSEDATYFDDIVMWRTQDQIYSEFGNQSCQTP